MHYRHTDILRLEVTTRDGPAGHVHDVYIHDGAWRVEYFVVDTGPRILGRRVLVSPYAARPVDWNARQVPLVLTPEDIRNSPDVDLALPVSLQQIAALHAHYGWPPQAFWQTDVAATLGAPSPDDPTAIAEQRSWEASEQPEADLPPSQVPLQSAREIVGHVLVADKGEVGELRATIVSDSDWSTPYLAVRLADDADGVERLLPTRAVIRVSWSSRRVMVALPAQALLEAPALDGEGPLAADLIQRATAHYAALLGDRRRASSA